MPSTLVACWIAMASVLPGAEQAFEKMMAELPVDPAASLALAEEWLEISNGSPHWTPVFSHGAAASQLRLGRTEESVALFESAIDGFTDTDRPVDAALAQNDLYIALAQLQRYEEGFAVLGQAIGTFEEFGRPVRAAYAELWMAQARLEAASDEQDLRQSLDSYMAIVGRFPDNWPRQRGVVHEGLATIHYLLEDPAQALVHAQLAVKHFESYALALGVASVRGVLGGAKVRMGHIDEGFRTLEAGLEEVREARWDDGIACNAVYLAESCRHLGRLECAARAATESLTHARAGNLPLAAKRALEVLIWHAKETGDVAGALARSAELVELTREVSRRSWSLQRGALRAQAALAKKGRALQQAKLESRVRTAELSQQRLKLVAVFCVSCVLLWTALWLFRLWRLSRAAATSSERGRILVETLNAELQHRFGNHLTVLRSLTARESRTVHSSEDASAALARLSRSIDAIASLDRLMRDPAAVHAGVCLTDVLEGALTMVEEIHGDERYVQWRVEGDEVYVVESMGLLMTLITVEAAINAYKHAFGGRSDGEIVARVVETDVALELRVEDNGCGLPQEGTKRRSGLKLIHDLAEQIDARFELRNARHGGTELSLSIPVSAWRPQSHQRSTRSAISMGSISVE